MHLIYLVSTCTCLLLLSSAAPSAVPDQTEQDAFTADQLLDRMSKAYATCKSYRDSGTVKNVYIRADGEQTVEKPFTTAFVRPDRFRFEYRDQKTNNRQYRYIIWSDGKVVQTWWDVRPGIEKPDSLAMALESATGVSSGAARRMPGLLISDPLGAGWEIKRLRDLKRLDDAKLDTVDCFRVQGETGTRTQTPVTFTRGPVTLWIEKSTFLVRRIDEQGKFDTFRTEQTTTYDPVFDGEITDKMLEFDPPKK